MKFAQSLSQRELPESSLGAACVFRCLRASTVALESAQTIVAAQVAQVCLSTGRSPLQKSSKSFAAL